MAEARGIGGTCAAGFEPVRDAFAESAARFPSLGAALTVIVAGETVVDLWLGFRDSDRTRPWTGDTIVNVASAVKGAVATLVHQLVEQGDLGLDDTVASRWPDFAQAGKEAITVRQLLTHQAGLPGIRASLPVESIGDWEALTSALAAEAPWWEPGTKHGYHVITWGFLVGEVLRRVTGKSVGALLRERLAEPLGLDLYLGLPDSEEHRVAFCPPAAPPPGGAFNPYGDKKPDPSSMAMRAFMFPSDRIDPGIVNTRAWRAAEVPASNGQGNARGLARLYGALANGGQLGGARVLRPETIERMAVEQVAGIDAVLGMEDRFALGFMLPSPMRPFGRGPRVFGHPGAGGSLGFADPDARVGFGYTPNQTIIAGMGGDPRWPGLLDAVYGCL